MLLRAPITPMSGEPLPAPWARGGKYSRKAFAFLPSALCVGARLIRRFFPSSCTTCARRWSAKGTWWRKLGRARLANEDCLRVLQKYGLEVISALTEELLDYSDRLMRSELRKLPAGTFTAEDFLDDDGVSDGPIRIAVSMRIEPGQGTVVIDFAGSDPQVGGSVNAVYAITYSACFYVLRCLLAEDAPATAGLMNAVTVLAPEGTIVNARMPAAVAGGNVETSQRIVDVLLRALGQAVPERVPAGKLWHHEQFDHRRFRSPDRPAFHLLRNYRWRHGRSSWIGRDFRCSLPHDEFAEHAD